MFKDKINVSLISINEKGPSSDVAGLEMGQYFTNALEHKGINIINGCAVVSHDYNEDTHTLNKIYLSDDSSHDLDILIDCSNRKANTSFIDDSKNVCKLRVGLEGTIRVDPFQRTLCKDIYAAGDPANVVYWVNGNRNTVNRAFQAQ